MTKKILVFIPFLLMACGAIKKSESTDELSIGFYNVENLFDTIDDPTKADEEYTPNSKKKYGAARYNEKLEHLGKVINAFPNGKPHVLGLAEVENNSVLEDLIEQHLTGFKIAHFESHDFRGIDVALLYNPTFFSFIKAYPIKVRYDADPDLKTRDILKVTGKFNDKEVHFFINHWPSRRGGKGKSMPKRMAAGYTLKASVDSVFSKNPKANVIIMGDMNDEPSDSSLTVALQADTSKMPSDKFQLYNLCAGFQKAGLGTYNYKSEYNMLDHIIVSTGLAKSAKPSIVQFEWMMYKKSDGSLAPSRSYSGNKYYGGYSDHLPVHAFLSL